MNLQFFYFLIILVVAIIGLIMFFSILDYKKEKDERNSIPKDNVNPEILDLLMTDKFLEKVNALIDSLIQQYTDVYQVMILSTATDIEFIKTKEQEEMQKYVSHMVVESISPELKKLIGLVYNVSTAEDLKNVINLRTKLFLINYIVQYNADIEE
jgi:hypothetical protein